MKAADRRRIEKHISRWTERLGLRDWDVVVSSDPPVNDGRVAETSWDSDLRVAQIRFVPRVLGGYYEEHTVVHELLHLTEAHRQFYHLIEKNPILSSHIFTWFEQSIDDAARFLLRLERERSP